MSQSNFKWVVIYGNGDTITITSTPEDLPNVLDFSEDIAAIVRYDEV